MLRGILLLLIVTFTAIQVHATELPGAERTLQATQQFLGLADQFQERFDQLCGPIYRHTKTLIPAEQGVYLRKADSSLQKKIKKGEKISCYGQWAYFINDNGMSGNILKSKVSQVKIPWQGSGKITVEPDTMQMRFSYAGRHLSFSIDPERFSKNRLQSINVPEFSKLSFQILTEGKFGSYGNLPTSTQMTVLDETYRFLARQNEIPDKFTFLSKLILQPHETSLQILSLSPVDWMGRPKKSELNEG